MLKPKYQHHTIPKAKNEYIPHAVLDLETAQGFEAEYQPICSVAFCLSEPNGEYGEPHHYLIQPPNNEIAPEVSEIHGITPKDTENAPDFSTIWPEIDLHLRERVLVAHNADFDFAVIEGELLHNGLTASLNVYTCTLDLARAAWKESWQGVNGFGLNKLADTLDIPLMHHQAASDASCSAEILKILMEECGAANPQWLSRKLKVPVGILGRPPRWKNGLRPYERNQRFKIIDGKWAVIAPEGVLREGKVVEITQRDGDTALVKINGDISSQESSNGGILEYTHNFDGMTESDAERYFWSR